MPTIHYLIRVGETVCSGSGDWVATPVAVGIRCADRQGNIECEVHQRWNEKRPDLRVSACDDLHLPRGPRRSLMIAICRTYQGCADHYCAEEFIVSGRDFAGWMDERFDYKRSARLLVCLEKRLLRYGQVVHSK